MAAETIEHIPQWLVDGRILHDSRDRTVALGIGEVAVASPLEVAWLHKNFENAKEFEAPLGNLLIRSWSDVEAYDASFLVTPAQFRQIQEAETRAPLMSADVLSVTQLFFNRQLDRGVRFDPGTEAAVARYTADRAALGRKMDASEWRLFRVQQFFRRNWLWNMQQGKRGEFKLLAA